MTQIKDKATIEKGLFHNPFWFAPPKDTFSERAIRFRELAENEQSEWRVYLELLAQLSDAQAAVAEQHRFVPPQHNSTTILPNIEDGVVPADFYVVLQDLLTEVNGQTTATVQQQLQQLAVLPREDVEAAAKRVLTQSTEESDKANIIWLQAALQIIWTGWAQTLQEDDVPPVEERTHCPCCGTEAVGSLVLIKGNLAGFRYMQCPHCNSRWNALRAKCLNCGDTGSVRIQEIDPENIELPVALVGARAESCDACHSYRKLYRLDKQQYADPIADDLASLTLDIMVGESGYERSGANPFLLLDE